MRSTKLFVVLLLAAVVGADGVPPDSMAIPFRCEIVLPEDVVAEGVVRSPASYGDLLPVARGRPDCDGPCRINIAFVYGDAMLEPARRHAFTPDGRPVRIASIGDLEIHVASWVDHTSLIWRENGLDAELRFVGMAHHPQVQGAIPEADGWVVDVQRFKERFDAHLVYAVLPGPAVGVAGRAFLGLVHPAFRWRLHAPYRVWDWKMSAGVIVLDNMVSLPHEIGHNLGLVHDPAKRAAERARGLNILPIWRGGQGFRGEKIVTIMAPVTHHRPRVERYSTSEATFTTEGRQHVLGRKGIHESVDALRWNLPRLALPPEPEDVLPDDYSFCDLGSALGAGPEASHTFDHGYQVFACVGGERDGKPWRTLATDYALDSRESALLYFFDRDNVEVLIKVLDGCGVNGHRWVFVGPVTSLAFRLAVREMSTGKIWLYEHPRDGETAQPRGDVTAFPCDATTASSATPQPDLGGGSAMVKAAGAGRDLIDLRRQSAESDQGTVCETSRPVLTLRGGYKVGMCYETYDGQVGEARDFELDSSQSALLYFFDRDNVEVLIKVLDGCGVNGHRWVFVAPVTDLGFNLYVESPAGRRWTHANRLGETASAASDVTAFPCTSDS